MRTGLLDSRKAEIVAGLLLVAVAAVVIRETIRMGAGWSRAGPEPGFFPFIAAVVMAGNVLAVIVLAARASGTRTLYDSREQAVEVLKVGGPIVGAVASLPYLGFYLMTALYMGLFAAWYGRYRWYVVLAASLLLPVALYFAFERGFRIALPKSALYGDLIPF